MSFLSGVSVEQGYVLDQVHNTDKGRLGPHGHLCRHRHSFQAFAYHFDATPEIGSRSIHFVNETDTRHVEAIRLPPHSLGLWLDAVDGIKDHHAAVEDAQAALHLSGKVDMSRRIDDVNAMSAPKARHRRRCDRDPALALLFHPVGDGSAVIHVAQAMRSPSVEQNALGGRRLARVDVGNDANIARALEWVVFGRLTCHQSCSLNLEGQSGAPTRQPRWRPSERATSGNGRRPCSPRPCDARPRDA
jgi:hypothetical protein